MLTALANRPYRRLFTAQVVALVGTGLATVALGLLAYDLAGADAGAVLGTAFAIKMVAYVGVGPLAGALAARLPRKGLLVGLDLARVGVVAALPWVDAIWQVHLLIFVLQAASAVFTPTFQATIPDLLPDEREYTRALSLSRLAYDLESLLSPLLAAAALLVVGHGDLFLGTAVGFAASALLVAGTPLPDARTAPADRSPATITRGVRAYLRTPRLRGLIAVHLAVAAAGSMVLVNTVGYVRELLGRDETSVAVALAAYGLGSAVAALALPRVLERHPDRPVVLRAAAALGALLALAALATAVLDDLRWPALLALWAAIGAAGALVLTPGGRLLRRSADRADLPAVFAADFSLSHACWLLCYPLAGALATGAGLPVALLVLAAIALAAALTAPRLWPEDDPESIEHEHHDLADDHAHVRGAALVGGCHRHAHAYRIDDLHVRWPG
ncbi:MFS transporter [Actinosynnema pretiosum subsp. pretiosum]|uniref:Major facilitator superfamily MFS_1 n=2 Tax=Actinosynnema TaxID=40566 RepID=C6WIP9_ACTMD|nr:MFS transporter [Actinosynnema mirum]ACU38139.1 major facilitator superfamily MFS_1 [Actinosynnema mirum DSM 43827]AXX31640.1 putative NreB protein [Actinosynnema pretiosum subsp. pretiosum]QUF04339.1 MFS transporter [Actinosynnema pretiosum subsp. pretiosum]